MTEHRTTRTVEARSELHEASSSFYPYAWLDAKKMLEAMANEDMEAANWRSDFTAIYKRLLATFPAGSIGHYACEEILADRYIDEMEAAEYRRFGI